MKTKAHIIVIALFLLSFLHMAPSWAGMNGPCMFQAAITATGQAVPGAENVSTVYIGIDTNARTVEGSVPTGVFTVYMMSSEFYSTDYREAGSDEEEWNLFIIADGVADPGQAGFFPVLSWNPNEFCPPDEAYLMLYAEDLEEGGRRLVIPDMYATTHYQTKEEEGDCSLEGDFCLFSYYVVWSKKVSVEMNMPAGWSMISLSVIPDNLALGSIFPEAMVAYRYERGAGYARIEESEGLKEGRGYWILFNAPQSYTITGRPIHMYTMPVNNSGWDMIGGCTYPAEPFIVDGNIDVIYRYTPGSGYQRLQEMDSLVPGKGYWILSSDIGAQAELFVMTPVALSRRR